jgi:hypothetical protein
MRDRFALAMISLRSMILTGRGMTRRIRAARGRKRFSRLGLPNQLAREIVHHLSLTAVD